MASENQSLALIESVDAMLPSSDTMAKMKEYAGTLLRSGMCAKGLDTPEKVLGAMLKGRELGLAPMKSVSGGIFVFNGRAGLEGQLMLDLIYARVPGVEIEFVETSPKQSVIKVKKGKDAQPQTFTFTMEQASAAKYDQAWDKESGGFKKKPTWGDPATMLTWRNVSRIGRLMFPHILGGAYLPDEVQDIESNDAVEVQVETAAPFKPKPKKGEQPAQEAAPVVDAEVVEPSAPQPAAPAPQQQPKPAEPKPAPQAAPSAPKAEPQPATSAWTFKDAMHEMEACTKPSEVGDVMRRVGAAKFPEDIAKGMADAATLKLAMLRGTTPVMDNPEEQKPKAPAMPALPLTKLEDFEAALGAGMDPEEAYASYQANYKDGASNKAKAFMRKQAAVKDRRAKGLA